MEELEFKGTKGEWEVGKQLKSLIWSDKSRTKYIAACDECTGISEKESEANAKLIAAAPELLESLIKMCEYHEKNASWDKGDNGYYKAKQTINKALK